MPQDASNRPNTEQGPTTVANLPVLVGTPAPRPSLRRHAIPASFLSQLLAERGHLSSQRTKRRATSAVATSAYQAGSDIMERRMPVGYGHSETA